MAYASVQIADEFISKAGTAGIDPMKLLKLTYLAQGWALGLYDDALIWNDVEAWRYGPVFREIYSHVAGRSVIKDRLTFGRAAPNFSARESTLIDQVWTKYGKKSGLDLSALTHAAESPWDVTYQKYGQNAVIPKELIREYYAKLAA
jgi:uncharacterized phage-associated protein